MSARRWRFLEHETIVLSRPDDGTDGELHRWRIIETPSGGIMVHRHVGPDPGRVLHDHPWSFVSVILRGGYVEEVADTRVASTYAAFARQWPATCAHGVRHERRAGSVHAIGLTTAHRIIELLRVPTWTLIVHGPRRRPWGFYPPSGYVDERSVDLERINLTGDA